MNAIRLWFNQSAARRVWLGVGAPVVGLVIVVIALSLLLLTSFARQQDDEYARSTSRLVLSAIESKQTALSELTLDYANWDAAVAATSRRLDRAWLEENFYSSVADGLIVFREDAPRHVWVAEGLEDQAAQIAVTAVATGRKEGDLGGLVMAPEVLASVRHSVWRQGERIALLAVAPITFEDDARRLAQARSGRPVDFLACVQILDEDEVAALGASLGLRGLRFESTMRNVVGPRVAVPIQGVDGQVIGVLSWDHERPGTSGFARLAWAVVLTLICVGVLALLLARHLVAWQLAMVARERAAKESDRLKTEFIATMSHELRTPLNGIIGYAELIEEDADNAGEAGPSIKTDAGRILKSARHLNRMISDILEQTKLEAGRIALQPEALNLAEALADVRDMIEPVARENGVRLITVLDGGVHEALADRVRVRQCLLNLAGNAAKFTREGSITFRVREHPEGGRMMAAIDVMDTGIGIAPDELRRLFTPFTQANSEVAARYGGAGLGLAISRKLARAMGGDIVAWSEPGKGSVFTLLLPLPAMDEARAA